MPFKSLVVCTYPKGMFGAWDWDWIDNNSKLKLIRCLDLYQIGYANPVQSIWPAHMGLTHPIETEGIRWDWNNPILSPNTIPHNALPDSSQTLT